VEITTESIGMIRRALVLGSEEAQHLFPGGRHLAIWYLEQHGEVQRNRNKFANARRATRIVEQLHANIRGDRASKFQLLCPGERLDFDRRTGNGNVCRLLARADDDAKQWQLTSKPPQFDRRAFP
jgi:hypothetical protein